MLENKNYDDGEIEILNKRLEAYAKMIKRLENELDHDC